MNIIEYQRFPADIRELARVLTDAWRTMATQLNQLSDGRVSAANNAVAAVPTAGAYQVGDFVRNSSPSELGSVGSKYVLMGWVCTSASPLAFKECRFLTGG